jgi:hypothetical protein
MLSGNNIESDGCPEIICKLSRDSNGGNVPEVLLLTFIKIVSVETLSIKMWNILCTSKELSGGDSVYLYQAV